jgi:hypothetical protein
MAIYRAIGEWLQANTPPSASVAALEVGAIGYYARRPMIDFAGLIQPAVAAQLTPSATYSDVARWAIGSYQPDYLVLEPAHFPELIEEVVTPGCTVAQSFAGELYGYPGTFTVFACRWARAAT